MITLSQENFNPNIFYSVVRTYIPDGIILDCECGGFEVKAPFELQNMQGKIHHLLLSSPVFKSEMECVAVLSNFLHVFLVCVLVMLAKCRPKGISIKCIHSFSLFKPIFGKRFCRKQKVHIYWAFEKLSLFFKCKNNTRLENK